MINLFLVTIFIFLLYITWEKDMATHSSTLAWKIPWMEEPGRLQSMELWRVRHDWVASLSLFFFMHWSRKWQPTPVFLPGESQGQRSLVDTHGKLELLYIKWYSAVPQYCQVWAKCTSGTSFIKDNYSVSVYISYEGQEFWSHSENTYF